MFFWDANFIKKTLLIVATVSYELSTQSLYVLRSVLNPDFPKLAPKSLLAEGNQ